MKINLMFVYRKYKKDLHDAIKEMSCDFPILKKSNIVVHMRFLDETLKKSFASHRNLYGKSIKHEIKLNPAVFFNSDINSKFKTVKDANYETVKDVIWHELGHSLQRRLSYCPN